MDAHPSDKSKNVNYTTITDISIDLVLFFSYLHGQVGAAGQLGYTSQVWENRKCRKWHEHCTDHMAGHPARHQLQKSLSAAEHVVQVEGHTAGMEAGIN